MTETDNQRGSVCNRAHGEPRITIQRSGSPYKIAEHIVLPGDKSEWFVEPTGERHPVHAGTREQAEILADAMEQAWRDGCQWRALGLHPWWDDVIGPLLDAASSHRRGEDHMPRLRDAADALRYLMDNDPNDTGGRAAYARRCALGPDALGAPVTQQNAWEDE